MHLFVRSVFVATAVLVCGVAPADAPAAPAFGEVTLFATVPTPPGFPEGIAVHDGVVYVAGPAAPGTAGNATPSSVVAFDLATAELLTTYDTVGEDLDAEHANTCIAFDDQRRLYVLNSQLGLYRVAIDTGVQESYGEPPADIPPCLVARPGTACSPGLRNRMPMANDIAFDAAGNAYVTDSLQATIWRIPPGGGTPQAWFQDFRFNAYIFGFIGINGIRVDPAGTTLYVSVTTNPRNRGVIYTLPISETPTRADLRVLHVFERGVTPDGLAFGASGRLYAVINGRNTQVIVLNADGSEYARITSPLLNSAANAAFDGAGSLLVVNHPISEGRRDPTLFRILQVYVDDTAQPLLLPSLP